MPSGVARFGHAPATVEAGSNREAAWKRGHIFVEAGSYLRLSFIQFADLPPQGEGGAYAPMSPTRESRRFHTPHIRS